MFLEGGEGYQAVIFTCLHLEHCPPLRYQPYLLYHVLIIHLLSLVVKRARNETENSNKDRCLPLLNI